MQFPQPGFSTSTRSRCHAVVMVAAVGNNDVQCDRQLQFREQVSSIFDHWDLGEIYSQRASVMPRFLWGSFRVALKAALQEILLGVARRNDLQQVRAWKLLLLLPRMLLHRPPRGGQISKDKLIARFDEFAAGQWQELLRASAKCAEDAGKLSRRQRRRDHVGDPGIEVCAVG